MSTFLLTDDVQAVLLVVNFGPAHAGLGTVGYQILDDSFSEVQARTTTDVTDLGRGFYGVRLLPGTTNFLGVVIWDIAVDSDVCVVDDIIISFAESDPMAFYSLAIKAKTDLIPAAGPPDAAHYTNARGDKLDDLDTAVSTRSSHSVADIWNALTSGLTTTGSIGKWIVDKLDVTVSSRSTYAGADTSGTTTLLSRLTSGRATNLDNLDAAISTRATAAAAATAVWAAATRTLTAVSDSSGVTTLLSRLTSGRASNLDFLDASVTNVPAAVWDVTAASHVAAGTTGADLAAAPTQTSVDAIKTELDAVKTQTDRIPRIRTQK